MRESSGNEWNDLRLRERDIGSPPQATFRFAIVLKLGMVKRHEIEIGAVVARLGQPLR